MPRGKFITLEGGEGAGKSTQAKKLAAFLRKKGIKVVLTREVGGTPGAEKIRKIWLEEGEGYWEPLAELMLIFAARREHLAKVIWPALKKGHWVICDRFMDSTRAYQGHGLMKPVVERLYREIADDFEPDLTLLLDMPVKASMRRVNKRGGWLKDRYELKEAAFHEKLRKTFLSLAKKHKKRTTVIDASHDLNHVGRDIEKTVISRLKLKVR